MMTLNTSSIVIGIVNTNPDLVELLKARIEAAAGFVVLVLHIADIRAWLDIETGASATRPPRDRL